MKPPMEFAGDADAKAPGAQQHSNLMGTPKKSLWSVSMAFGPFLPWGDDPSGEVGTPW